MHTSAIHHILIVIALCTALLGSAEATGNAVPTADDLIQELTQLPSCTITCVTSALSASQCGLSDFPCLCKDEAYIASAGSCVLSTCTHKGALLTQGWQKRACNSPVRDIGPASRSINIALFVIATVAVSIRFLARWRIQDSTFGWDDWTILASYAFLVPSTAIFQIMTFVGLGRDIWTVAFDDITLMFKWFYIDQYLYQVIIVLTKVSIVLLYLRIFPKSVSTRFTNIGYTLIAALVAYAIGFLVYSGFQCAPISYFWIQWDGEHTGYCNNFQLAVYINSGLNILFDLVVFCLPIPKLSAIQVRDKRRKVGVVLTFLVGLFVTACSVVRLKYLSKVSEIVNPTYDYTKIALWSGIECEVGVICACMPTIIGPTLYFFRERFGSQLASFSKSGAEKTGTTRSRIVGDGRVERLPSTASGHEFEMDDRECTLKHGGIERTRETEVCHISREQSGDDDVKLIYQGYGNDRKDQWSV